MARARLLYVTDLTYQAQGRVYRDEDLWLSAALNPHFDIALCHPLSAAALMDAFDGVVVRNSGPVIHYQARYDEFKRAALERDTIVFNQLTGRADMCGKQYLVDLSREGAAVIPTVDRHADIELLPDTATYVVKPKLGSDSVGLQIVSAADVAGTVSDDGDVLIQPRLAFEHEVSFYFLDHTFHYAMYAPDPLRRWELRPFDPSASDIAFATWFIEWNAIEHGIQRVDACRLSSGELLLMELEDMNPHLALDALDESTRDHFVHAIRSSITSLLDG